MWENDMINKLDFAKYLGITEGQINTIISKMRQRLTVFAPSVSGITMLNIHEAASIEFVLMRMKEFNQDKACDLAVKAFYKRNVTRVKKVTC
ncbi:hypothetical protein MKY04_16135 [Lysinibacillus telephonicus]|uniref:hypothetical protein n=1 Tax=Lysinibacillus telephonicus TaxID=1714840 RepID=UPI0031FD80D8